MHTSWVEFVLGAVVANTLHLDRPSMAFFLSYVVRIKAMIYSRTMPQWPGIVLDMN
jgi:hypothetical protein